MADKRISDLPPLAESELDAAIDLLAIADVSATETKKVTAASLIAQGVNQVPEGSLSGNLITDGSLPGSKLESNSITERELAPNSVNTIHVVDAAITNEKLAGGITGDKINDGQIGGNHLQDNAINGSQQIQDRSIAAIKLQQNTLTADEIAPNAIGSSELAAASVDTSALQDDSCSTPKYKNASVTNDKLANGIDGSKLLNLSVTNAKLAGGISGEKINDLPLSKLPDAPGNTVLAGPTTVGTASPTYRKLISADLPTATDSTKGAVSLPPSGGLSVSSDGAASIGNTVAPDTKPVVTYNEHGLITSGRDLQAGDMPPAQPGELGAVKEGDGITISGDGTISQSLTGVVAGEYTKVTVDERGSVTEGAQLSKADIPNIDWDQIDGSLDLSELVGELNTGQIADKAVTRPKLADYSISYIQEAQPVIDLTVHVGCMWFQESTASLNMWNGNSWMSVGQGRLSAENLRYCGVVNATTGLISGVTQFGVTAGFEIGAPVPAPTDPLTGVYFVIDTPGNGITQTPGVTYDAGDWCLCNGAAAGWIRIDTMVGGGGGGGGASRLQDLLDVNVAAASEGALLQLQSSGMWTDIYSIDCGEY